jgi:RimJ/RimL family protein N-acetyltransferase
MNWITQPLILEGEKVKLVPLSNEYFDELTGIAADKRIWEFLSIPGWQKEELQIALKSALLKRMNGEEYPFVIIDKLTNKAIGSTRYMEMDEKFRKLEIGWTWYTPEYWGTKYNFECKLLLLTHAFEKMDCVRVQLKTWDKNLRSQAAIKKIGGKLEGTLRNHMIRYDGQIRNTVMFSIINSEWPEAKQALIAKLK